MGRLLQGPLKTLDSDCSKEEKQYAEWVTVRARVALLEASLPSLTVSASMPTPRQDWIRALQQSRRHVRPWHPCH